MYRRITKTVKDKGKLVPYDDYLKEVTDPETDWYVSPFIYGEDALDYFKKNKGIKGYQGEAFTDLLYWDLDLKADFSKVQNHAKNLVDKLNELGLKDCFEVFFSGNKGIHVIVYTQNKMSPQVVSKICFNIAKEVKIPMRLPEKIFDTTVYNLNRIFRINNTKHPESGLYKIFLEPETLQTYTEDQIRATASKPYYFESKLHLADITSIIEKYGKEDETSKIVEISEYQADALDCPPGKRRCMHALESGKFGPGERENATIRIAANLRGQGFSREAVKDVVDTALIKREKLFDGLNTHTDADIWRNIDQVFSKGWNGGTYTCRTDDFLAALCDTGNGPCCLELPSSNKLNVVNVRGLIDQYIQYGNEALKEYPKSGLAWLDKMIRLRPRNYTILNGSVGSGKTSLALQLMESLNKQKIYHIFFSLDMADSSLFEKVGSRYTNYSQKQIEDAFNINFKKDNKNIKIREEVVVSLETNLPYTYFDFTSCVDSRYMETTVEMLKDKQESPIQFCVVDYAGRLVGEADNDFANSTQAAKSANDIAKRGNVHYLYLSQIPRGEGDLTTVLHSSRVSKSSGAWEENATIVLNCWRPFGNGLQDLDRYMHLYVAKNRSGPLGERVYLWDGKRGIVEPMSDSEFQDYEKKCEQYNKPEPPASQRPERDIPANRWNQETGDNDVRNQREELRDSSRFTNSGSRFSTS